jgi:ATP-dependent DNA ligase
MAMTLPVLPPVKPMLAKSLKTLPRPDAVPAGLLYEPKWDGFRCIVFRDGDEVELGSRNERPLTRYFPEVVAAALRELPERCVVDGEIIIEGDDGLDFEALLQRIHPAASRVTKLSLETPARFVAFDLLAIGNEDLRKVAFSQRRERLLEVLAKSGPGVTVTPATTDFDVATEWFDSFEGAGLDGIVAKPLDVTYVEDGRAMFKIKHQRTADVVVAGFRWHKSGPVVGSLLLGLYGDAGTLHHVGVAASFTMSRRAELVEELKPYLATDAADHPWGAGFNLEASPVGRMPGAVSRWNAGKDLTWTPLRPELVCEVAYDHLQGDRFRHATQFLRWRPDREPSSCTYSQLETPTKFDLGELLAGS